MSYSDNNYPYQGGGQPGQGGQGGQAPVPPPNYQQNQQQPFSQPQYYPQQQYPQPQQYQQPEYQKPQPQQEPPLQEEPQQADTAQQEPQQEQTDASLQEPLPQQEPETEQKPQEQEPQSQQASQPDYGEQVKLQPPPPQTEPVLIDPPKPEVAQQKDSQSDVAPQAQQFDTASHQQKSDSAEQPQQSEASEQPKEPEPSAQTEQPEPEAQPQPDSVEQPQPDSVAQPQPETIVGSQPQQPSQQIPLPSEPNQYGGSQPQQTPFAPGPDPTMGNQPPTYIPGATPTDGGQPSPKKSKRTLLIVLIIVGVIVLGLVGALGFNAIHQQQLSDAYASAAELMGQGDYQSAYDKYIELGDYEDSAEHAEYCLNAMAFDDALALLDDKKYSDARAAFNDLGSFMDANKYVKICDGWLAFEEAVELTDAARFEEAAIKSIEFVDISEVSGSEEVKAWQNRNSYGLADKAFYEGKFYEAYVAFSKLRTYEDSEARAQACVHERPGNHEFYHDGGFVSSSTDVVFDAGSSPLPFYLRVYSGDTLVSSVFVNPGSSTTIQLPEGDYVFKSASGDLWFGENDMFGAQGYYEILIFDGMNESVHLDGNMVYTMTLHTSEGGNVGGRNVNRDSF